MHAIPRNLLLATGIALSSHAAADVTFYERENFGGQTFTTARQVGDFTRLGFNDRASSVIVAGEDWEVCDDVRFRGRCMVLRPGRYPSLAAMGLNDRVSSVRQMRRDGRVDEGRYAPAPPVAGITFYENESFTGRTFSTDRPVVNFREFGFNDRASSAVVGGGQWEVCDDARFGGRCMVLRPGRYPSLAAMALNDRISSARDVGRGGRVDDNRYAPVPVGTPDYRRRADERLYQAEVTSVRAVVGNPGQRCWMAHEQVAPGRRDNSVPGTIVGAVIGGILGHQVGGGRGQGVATAGGAVAGAVVGGTVGRGNAQEPQYQDVQRCESAPAQATPAYWDVTYDFRGQEHHVQMTEQPGRTVIVNERGEPRA
jgi:uncharacterized protein YcfJ